MSRESYKYDRYLQPSSDARWAYPDEIKNKSLKVELSKKKIAKAGIPLISDGKQVYLDDQDSHTLVWGSTGSKKTRLFVMPLTNLCISAGESFVVMDPKGEIYNSSINHAVEEGYNIITLNLRDLGYGDQWNPLALPYRMYKNGNVDEAAEMIDNLVNFLASSREKESDRFWPIMASRFIAAHIFFLFDNADEDEINLKSVAQMCSENSCQIIKNLIPEMNKDSVYRTSYDVVLGTGDKTRTSITSYAYSLVSMFSTQNQLAATLSKDSFSFADIGKKKTAVYLIVPDEKSTYHFLASMFTKQLYESLIETAQRRKNRQLPIRMNFILDEFCNMPEIPDMCSMITAARSRNMRFYLFMQGLHQLRTKYGEDANTIKGNCDTWFFLNSRELDLLDEISNLCGTKNIGAQTLPLISISQLQHLNKDKGESILFYHREYPFLTNLADISEYESFCSKINASDEKIGNPFDTIVKTFKLEALFEKIKEQKAARIREEVLKRRKEKVSEILKARIAASAESEIISAGKCAIHHDFASVTLFQDELSLEKNVSEYLIDRLMEIGLLGGCIEGGKYPVLMSEELFLKKVDDEEE